MPRPVVIVLRRATAIAALIVLTALLVAVAAPAAGAEGAAGVSGAPTALSATVPASVVYPAAATVSGSVSVPGATLTLLSRPAGAADWSFAGSATAGSGGDFRIEVAALSSADLRVVYAGDDAHAPAAVDLSLIVRPRVTTSFAGDLWLGETVVLRGAVAPAHPGAPVFLERRVGTSWQAIGTATLSADSRFAYRWQPQEFGFYRLRARIAADADHGEGASRGERVTVNRPNRHDVPYRYEHYIVIVRHLYRLYYYEHGALVRSFNVALGRPGYPTPLGHFKIWAKRRPAGGALGSCAMYYHGSIAIHGTNQAYLLRRFPRNFSHGCARMYNAQALWLYRHCPRGTPVHNLR